MEQIIKFRCPPYTTPDWLGDLNALAIRLRLIPLRQILEKSLYYPSSGMDAKPIKHAGGDVHSFVYADYGISKDRFTAVIKEPGLKGYRIVEQLEVTDQLGVRDWENPGKKRFADYIQEPFAYWVVWERKQEFTDDHGPERLSLLHLCAEGVTAYRRLYIKQRIAPKYLTIIQPGHGFGCNWTDYTEVASPMHQTVMSSRKIPEFLINGGWCRDRASRTHYHQLRSWPEYSVRVSFITGRRSSFGIWGQFKKKIKNPAVESII